MKHNNLSARAQDRHRTGMFVECGGFPGRVRWGAGVGKKPPSQGTHGLSLNTENPKATAPTLKDWDN